MSNLPICCETRHQVGKDGGESQANLHACPVREMERKIKQRYDGSSKTNRSLVDDIQAFCKVCSVLNAPPKLLVADTMLG